MKGHVMPASETAAPQVPARQEEFVELVTVAGVRYRNGQPAPTGTITTPTGADIPVAVEGWGVTGDWITIGLSGGYEISIPEARIERVVLRTATDGTA